MLFQFVLDGRIIQIVLCGCQAHRIILYKYELTRGFLGCCAGKPLLPGLVVQGGLLFVEKEESG